MKFEKLLVDILLTETATFNEGRMINFIKEYSKRKGYHVKKSHNNLYVTKGNAAIYPCFVAHTDTCAKILPHGQFQLCHTNDHANLIGWNRVKDTQTQVGFDDKIGIFIALKMMEKLPAAKCFFPYAEESGCIGTQKADMTFFKDCAFCIQCDRQNAGAIVDEIFGVDLISQEFGFVLTDAMNNRKFTDGNLTDVYELKQKDLDVSCINIECGYYMPHTNFDYCIVGEVYDTLDLVERIVKTAENKRYLHAYTKPSYQYWGNYGKDYSRGANSQYYGYDWETNQYYDSYGKYYGNHGKSFRSDSGGYSKKDISWYDGYANGFIDYCEGCDENKYLTRDAKSGLHLCAVCYKVFYGHDYTNSAAK